MQLLPGEVSRCGAGHCCPPPLVIVGIRISFRIGEEICLSNDQGPRATGKSVRPTHQSASARGSPMMYHAHPNRKRWTCDIFSA